MEYDFGSFDAMRGAAGVTTISAAENPEAANAALEGLLDAGAPPAPPVPSADFVYLPTGYRPAGEDEFEHYARVRELTGADEEAMTRAGTNPFRYFDTVIRRATVEIGEEPANDRMLRSLTVDDRETLLLGIRIATFGENYTWEQWRCPECADLSDLTFHLPDLMPTKPAVTEYNVVLRGGRIARMRLADGDDQAKLYEREDLTLPEQNTIMIGRCLVDIKETKSLAFAEGCEKVARELGIADRNAIIKEMLRHRYGPKLEDIEITHEACGQDVKVSLSMVAIFR